MKSFVGAIEAIDLERAASLGPKAMIPAEVKGRVPCRFGCSPAPRFDGAARSVPTPTRCGPGIGGEVRFLNPIGADQEIGVGRRSILKLNFDVVGALGERDASMVEMNDPIGNGSDPTHHLAVVGTPDGRSLNGLPGGAE